MSLVFVSFEKPFCSSLTSKIPKAPPSPTPKKKKEQKKWKKGRDFSGFFILPFCFLVESSQAFAFSPLLSPQLAVGSQGGRFSFEKLLSFFHKKLPLKCV